ncbi:hypothetical protein KXR95_04280 [Paenibacillus humicus]
MDLFTWNEEPPVLQEKAGSRLLLVDGMAILFRAYFATAYGGSVRRTSSGLPVNAVHGFVRYFMDAVRKFQPTHVACCWDLGSTTFRTGEFSNYVPI